MFKVSDKFHAAKSTLICEDTRIPFQHGVKKPRVDCTINQFDTLNHFYRTLTSDGQWVMTHAVIAKHCAGNNLILMR